MSALASESSFVFTSENFQAPQLPSNLKIVEVPVCVATDETLKGYGFLVRSADEFTTINKKFEIVKWPQPGWRALDPDTGDEGGTTEGNFNVRWEGDYYCGENLAVSTTNNKYLDGLAVPPEVASRDPEHSAGDGRTIHLWMSDYHPDGGQLFWPHTPVPFTVCLGANTFGDDIQPENMRAFSIPSGFGVYIHPGTWHNGIYVRTEHTPASFLTRQGKVHARISVSWANEFSTLLRVPL